MTEMTPFDSRPDPELGAALRAALGPTGEAEFASRFRAALAAESPLEVLARWVWPGLAAAAATLLLAAGLWSARPNGASPSATLDQAFGSDGVGAMVAAADRPNREVVLVAALGEGE
ncbi:MAG TPA: hypothetical protein VLA95_05805 [Gemmatimonadales bacterium]|nr:hypothetical protein [Gemmatimonadales bacterium]